jgi:hypothetical protein
MRAMKRIVALVTLAFYLVVVTYAQDILVIAGGSRTQPDPKDRKLIQAIAENDSLRLTLGKSHLWKHKRARIIGVYLKVENLSDSQLGIRTDQFSATDASGRGYAGLETEEAIKRFNDTHGLAIAVLAGPLLAPMAQAKTAEAIRRGALQSGIIPAHSFKEGMIFFEAPKEQRYTMNIMLGSLWPEPFVISTEKPKR